MRRFLYALCVSATALVSSFSLQACNRDDDDNTTANPVPDRTPYTGEWAGEFVRTGAGKEDDIEISVTLGGADNQLSASIIYLTNAQRRDFVATWNGTRGVFEGTVDGRSNTISLSGSSLRYAESGNGEFTSTLSDARNKWIGAWTGTLACIIGSSDPVAWTIAKGPGRTDLVLANTATPGTPFATVPLTRGAISGQFSAGGKAYTYTADYVDFSGQLNVGATQVGDPANGCTLGLSK